MAGTEIGAGQQDPPDSAGDFNALNFIISQRLARVSTVKLVEVKAVDADAKTVDVQIMVGQVDGDGTVTPHGTIFGIPYSWVQAGRNAVKLTPAIGDKGWMAVCDRDISAVKSSKAIGPPGSPRKFDPADGVYLFSIAGLNEVPDQTIEFTDDGISIVDKNENRQTFGAAGININGLLINRSGQVQGVLPVTGALQLGGSIDDISGDPYTRAIRTSGDIESISGEVTASSIPLSTHKHTGVAVGGGTSGGPVP